MYDFIPLPIPPQPHGAQSSTFRQPPIDGTLTAPEMYDWHAENSPNHPLFVYPDDDGEIKTLTWREVVRAAHRAGRIFKGIVDDGSPAGVVTEKPVIAFLANSDLVTFWTVLAGVLRANYIPAPISPRNSPGAVAHLLKQTGARFLVLGPEAPMQELALAGLRMLEEANAALPRQISMPTFADIYVDDDAPPEPLPALKLNLEDVVIISHSSGSTAYPKPIKWRYLRQLCVSRTLGYGETDCAGKIIAVHGNPMFHSMGLIQLGLPAVTGWILSGFKPQSPAITPTPESMIKAVTDTKADYVFTVPSFVEAWAKNPEYVQVMKSLKGLLWGGGPLPKEVGDYLVTERIKSYVIYGLTECGFISQMILDGFMEDWEYFRITPDMSVELLPAGDGYAQLVVVARGYKIPSVINTKVGGADAYDTNDILAAHPTKPGLWRIYGRADDQIMHSTGEKTNPGPLEGILKSDSHVNACVMFGRSRFNAGVIVDPKPEFSFDPRDETRLIAFRNMIWPTVERMNNYAPQHSRIFKEMIIVTSPEKPFTYTAKGTLRRQAVIDEYEPEIDALYDAVEQSNQAGLVHPSSWTPSSAVDFVREAVIRVMNLNSSLGNEDDLFHRGCDSLQATWIRNSLLHALRSSGISVRNIPPNFVYSHPTILGLANFLLSLKDDEQKGHDSALTVAEMQSMVGKYSSDLPVHRGQVLQPSVGDIYLVTGTTGGLGCALLAVLSGLPNVQRIYAFNRSAKTALADRQRNALQDRGYDVHKVMESGKVIMVEGETDRPQLGVSVELYDELRNSVTHIIHNAWPVNFNWSLKSFEPSVKGVRNLGELSLSSSHRLPPRILFVSSIGVLSNVDLSRSFKEISVDPAVAVGSGYGESKWVAERFLEILASETPIRTVSVRLGQLSGSVNGAWNRTDWLPSLIKSSVHLNCMPTMDKDISWIPVDAAALALTEMIDSDVSPLHLLHPRPVSWPSIIDPLAKVLGLPVIPFNEWVDRLEKSGKNLSADHEIEVMRQNPALKILGTFVRASRAPSACREALGVPQLDVTEAQKVSPALSLQQLPQLSVRDGMLWLKYWKDIELL